VHDITKQETFIIPRYYIILDSSFENENKKSFGRHYGQPPQYESFFVTPQRQTPDRSQPMDI